MILNVAKLMDEADVNCINCQSYNDSLTLTVSQNHIVVDAGRNLWRLFSLPPHPCSKQSCLEQVAQGPVQSGFECLQSFTILTVKKKKKKFFLCLD